MTSMRIGHEKRYYFASRFFSLNGKNFEIIATESTGRTAHDAIHTIRDLQTMKIHEVPMNELIKKYKSVTL